MSFSLRLGLRSLIRLPAETENPPTGQRALVAHTDGWYDRTSAGVERLMSGPQVIDSNTPPAAPTQPYLRLERDGNGVVQRIYLGTP